MKNLLFAFASTSGHTEFVCQTAQLYLQLKKRSMQIVLKPIERIKQADLDAADVIVLASGTWNTEGIEGQLNPYMYRFVQADFSSYDFGGKKVAVIGCGDARYKYTCRAAQYLEEYVDTHNAKRIDPTLRMINEPYHQVAAIEEWCDALLPQLK